MIIFDSLSFNNSFKPNQQPDLAKHIAVFLVMYLDHLVEVHLPLAILFSEKSYGWIHKKFPKKEEETITIRRDMMKI